MSEENTAESNRPEYTSAGDIVGGNRKDVTCPDTGHVFKIRRISPVEFMSSGTMPVGDIGTMVAMADKSQEEIMAEYEKKVESLSEDTVMEFFEMLLCRGVCSLNVVGGDEPSDISKGTVHYSDLEIADQTFLVGEIVSYSGITLGAWGVTPSKF